MAELDPDAHRAQVVGGDVAGARWVAVGDPLPRGVAVERRRRPGVGHVVLGDAGVERAGRGVVDPHREVRVGTEGEERAGGGIEDGAVGVGVVSRRRRHPGTLARRRGHAEPVAQRQAHLDDPEEDGEHHDGDDRELDERRALVSGVDSHGLLPTPVDQCTPQTPF